MCNSMKAAPHLQISCTMQSGSLFLFMAAFPMALSLTVEALGRIGTHRRLDCPHLFEKQLPQSGSATPRRTRKRLGSREDQEDIWDACR